MNWCFAKLAEPAKVSVNVGEVIENYHLRLEKP